MEGDRPVLAALLRAIWKYRARTLGAAALMIVSKLAFVAVPWLLKRIVEALSHPDALRLLPVFLLLAYAAMRFAGTLFGELRDLLFSPVTQDTVADFKLRAFEHLHRLGPRFHAQRQTGALINDVERGTAGIGYVLGVGLFTALPTIVEISAVLIVMLSAYDLVFGAIIAATFVAYTTVTLVLTRRRVVWQRQLNALNSAAGARIVDSLLNYETVKANAGERVESQRLRELLAQWTSTGVRTQKALSTLHVSQSAVIAFGVGAVMLHAGHEVVMGPLTVGDLILINAYIIQVCLPLNALGFVFREARDALTAAERLFALMEQAPEIAEPPNLPALRVARAAVRFENVDFGYEEGRQILWRADFAIAPGGTVAVVGGSGSGKSTLARLLLRFYEPARGRILIDDQDIRAVSQASLRNAIGLVPQDTILFNDTIAYNIAYGRTGASLAEVIEAAKAAHVHDFIANLPQGYDTRVGERGLKLSGGEKQRVAIARAILKDPPILVFDEATSALDTRAERAIQEELDRISRDRTTLVIAHRLSTIVDADEIIVLERGHLVERGKHGELLRRQGVYAQMWSLQQQQRELEHTEHRLSLQAVNLATLAAGVIDGLRPIIDAKEIRLYTSLAPEGARVSGDPSSLQQVLWDLCANAIDVTPRGGRMELRVERAGPSARVTVVDGREPGPRPSDPALPRASTTPLDPLRVKSIVEEHQGEFDCTPSDGGAAYRIDLPLRAVASALPRTGVARPTSLEGVQVVAVDDQAEAREMIAAVLQGHGASVRTLGSVRESLEWFSARPRAEWPQVLVCDISLGDEDGYTLIRKLRALEAERHMPLAQRLPAIALSGYAQPEDRMRALLAGFQIHLAKPVDPRELAATIAALAQKPSAHAAEKFTRA